MECSSHVSLSILILTNEDTENEGGVTWTGFLVMMEREYGVPPSSPDEYLSPSKKGKLKLQEESKCLVATKIFLFGFDEDKGDSPEEGGILPDSRLKKMDLLDLPLSGRRFTWKGLNRLISDHCVVILSDNNRDWGPKPFKVINAWFDDMDFAAFVERTWANLHVSGWRMFALKEKLKTLKASLKTWNEESFGIIDTKIESASRDIHELDLKGESMDLSDDGVRKRSTLWADLWQARSMQHNLLYQKSRSRWLKEGDTNSKYLHGLVNSRRRFNTIQRLDIANDWIEDVKGVIHVWLVAWEMDLLLVFGMTTRPGMKFSLLASVVILVIGWMVNKSDSWEWRHDKLKQYSVKSAYKLLAHHVQQQSLLIQHLLFLWRSKAPLKVTTFAWRLFQGKIPSKEALSIRGVSFPMGDGLSCPFCNDHP
ncbi:hypothetical protein Lal_00018471 [Lupinus albus]|nr:hypothetical protein Lal_00018471 [Lupinus albus]